MTLRWVAVEARTGLVIADLPGLDVGTVKATIGRYESCTATLPVPTAPANWLRATLPGGTCLVLLDDPGTGVQSTPVWGGLVSTRQRGIGDTVDLGVATVEAYLDRRYVGDITYSGLLQSQIVQSLVETFAAEGAPSGLPGLPFEVQRIPGADPARDRTYADADDKTVYAALQALAGLQGGIEWTVVWQWRTDDPTHPRLIPVVQVGSRLGTSPTPGLKPSATFEAPGAVTDALLVEDYSTGKGATSVVAYSSGQGSARPQSPPQLATDPDRPTFEYRWSPSSSITDVDTLTSHAQRALALLAPGANALSLAADLSAAPALGRDWGLGDDVGYKLAGAGFPAGLEGVGRAIGWQLELPTQGKTGQVTPILAVDQITEAS